MNENIIRIVRHPTTHKVAIGVAAFGGGLVIGYLLGRREPSPLPPRHKEELDEISSEVAKIRERRLAKVVIDEEEHRRIAASSEEPESEEAVLMRGTEDEDEHGKVIAIIEPEDREEKVVTRNVFAEAAVDDDWDYEVEVRNRTSTEPYVLHKDEFYADEMGFSQHTYTYYEGDDILADEEDKPIYNHAQIVGELKFGHGSGDAKVVHVRNEKRKEEYEIVKDPGLFSIEVLGLQIENNDRARGIEHSASRRFKPQE